MPFVDGNTLLVLLVMAAGAGAFLRVVAKEKHRREQHLKLRFEEKVKELQTKVGKKERPAPTTPADDVPVTLESVEDSGLVAEPPA